MSRLAGTIDGVIGVDTHRDTLAPPPPTRLVACSPRPRSAPTRPATSGCSTSPRRRCPDGVAGRWRAPAATALGLPAFLQARGERVVEVGRPKRPPRRTGAKSDALDAVRAAREALAQDHPLTPRRRGDREALRVLLATRHSACAAKVSATNQLKALIVGAPEELRAELRGLATKQQIRRCATLRDRPARSLEHRMTVRALRSTAQRIQLLAVEAAGLRADLVADPGEALDHQRDAVQGPQLPDEPIRGGAFQQGLFDGGELGIRQPWRRPAGSAAAQRLGARRPASGHARR